MSLGYETLRDALCNKYIKISHSKQNWVPLFPFWILCKVYYKLLQKCAHATKMRLKHAFVMSATTCCQHSLLQVL